MKIIFNADDFGYSEAVNRGIIKCFKDGVLRSTTLMTNAFGFEDAVELAKQNPGLGIGVHLTLTFGRPLLGYTNTLTDSSGKFHKVDYYTEGNEVSEEELYAEWDAQIRKVYEAGITPTHLDSHHHTHSFGSNQKVVLKLAEKYNLPIRNNFELSDNDEIYFDAGLDQVGIIKVDENYDKNIEKLVSAFWAETEGQEAVEVMCHPAYLDFAIVNNSSFAIPRVYQLEFFTNSSFAKELLSREDIELINYSQLIRK